MESDKMDDSIVDNAENFLIGKYLEAAEKCEHLAEKFSNEENIQQVFNDYTDCLVTVGELLSLETSTELLKALENVQSHFVWQKQQLQEAIAYEGLNLPDGISPTGSDQDNCDKPPSKPKSKEEEKSANRRLMIKSTLRTNNGNGFEDIAGLDGVKAILRKSVLLPMSFPTLFHGGRKPWTQILLFGPPGTGKSKMASSLASEANAEFYSISSADLLSSWVGESEKMIKELFEYTRTKKDKCIVFIDEIDSICRKRTNREGDHTRSMKNQLLVEFDQNLSTEANCFVLCATNCPWDIDSAFMRRFQRRIYVPLPDREARLTLMKNKCAGINNDMSDDDWNSVLDKTEGYSGSDLVNVANYALQEPLGEIENNEEWIVVAGGKWKPAPANALGSFSVPLSSVPPDKIIVRNVCLQDFNKAIALTPKTVLKQELEKYNKFISEQL